MNQASQSRPLPAIQLPDSKIVDEVTGLVSSGEFTMGIINRFDTGRCVGLWVLVLFGQIAYWHVEPARDLDEFARMNDRMLRALSAQLDEFIATLPADLVAMAKSAWVAQNGSTH